MSHRWDCPTRWEAERQGERAFERGGGRWSNPYDERNSYDHSPCREAERAWEDGHRAAERRQEEEAIERRNAARQRQEREWAQQEEEALYMRGQEEDYWQQQYDEAMAAAEHEHYFWMEQDQLLDQSEMI